MLLLYDNHGPRRSDWHRDEAAAVTAGGLEVVATRGRIDDYPAVRLQRVFARDRRRSCIDSVRSLEARRDAADREARVILERHSHES